jgi:hypothetical protein
MTLTEIIDAATKLGRSDGSDAATWYFDEGRSDVTREHYQRVLKGIADCDPEIMDSIPAADFSGQWADGRTVRGLLAELGTNDETVSAGEQDEIVRAYEEAFSDAAQDAIEAHCHLMLEQDVTFTLSVKTEQDPERLLSMLTDLLARENCDIDQDEFEIT